ncbi:hypothetical protein TRAPUB_4203 [Trametes pubescens]|uniref:Uncharacterized protein n=1 Tax=Trametes pubescens TaxID=154538 RepID=A0A1M2VBN8_TRAPU|nr:hypothetical protein TRAPUB_4203 [Trametes pubescens]
MNETRYVRTHVALPHPLTRDAIHDRQRFGQAHAAKTPRATAEDVVTAFENASEDDLKVFREAAIAHLTKPKKVRKDAKGKGKAT